MSEAYLYIPEAREKDPMHDIVVTGIGAISPLGPDIETNWENILNGVSALSKVDVPATSVTVGGKISDGLLEGATERFLAMREDRRDLKKELRTRIPRQAQLALLAATEALQNAGLLTEQGTLSPDVDSTRIGAYIATGTGGAARVAKVERDIQTGKPTSPFDILYTLLERTVTVPGRILRLMGPISTPVLACSSSNVALIEAARILKLGEEADIMLAGGAESTIDPYTYRMFEAMRANTTNPDPETASRPLDFLRDGFAKTEGAAILVLERRKDALKRGARIIADFAGYGHTADAYHDTNPSGEGAARAMRQTIAMAQLDLAHMDPYIFIDAHATGTEVGDPKEAEAIRDVFGDAIGLAVIAATKAITGHLLGAAGAFESAIAALALRDQIVPPSRNVDPLHNVATEYGLRLAPMVKTPMSLQAAINNSFGFGGGNAVTGFKRAVFRR